MSEYHAFLLNLLSKKKFFNIKPFNRKVLTQNLKGSKSYEYRKNSSR